MPINPPDERRVINPTDGDFTNLPLTAVTAIDTISNADADTPFGFGTGVIISPNYVLTAAHNLVDKSFLEPIFQDDIRVSSSGNHELITDRRIGQVNGDFGSNVSVNTGLFIPFLDEYIGTKPRTPEEAKFDIGLIEVDQSDPGESDLISPRQDLPVGLTAFVVTATIRREGIPIQTAGYPVDNIKNTFPAQTRDNLGIPDRQGNIKELPDPNNPNDYTVRARDLVLAPGNFDEKGTVVATSGRRIEYSNDIDTEPGQSGSPIWHTLEGDAPRVLGVHSRGPAVGRNVGTLIDKEAYDKIMAQIQGDEDPNLLPENAIIGSDPTGIPGLPGGNDLINGTYRKERILGRDGDDTIFGAGADDRLEGEQGDDILEGGAGDDLIDGGKDLDFPIIEQQGNDIAVFSASRNEYNIETSGGGLFSDEMTIVTHLNGGIDGTDTLTNIEFIQFADGTIPLPIEDDGDGGNPNGQVNFTGGAGNDNLIGNSLNNVMSGEGGNDRLEGRLGNDSVFGGAGIDTLKGEEGNDFLFGGGNDDRLFGGEGQDELYGEAGNDTMFGGDGNDIIGGNLGNNYISGGDGFDALIGDINNDTLYGGNDSDQLFAKEGNDSLYGQNGNDSLYGEAGEDRLEGGNNSDRLGGGAGQDTLKGDGGNDFVSGGDDNDTIIGGDGNDRLFGVDGNDLIYGSNGADRLAGGNNNDRLFGGNGVDVLKGDRGNDLLYGGNNNDTLIGGDNNDNLYGQNNNDRIFGENGNDRLEGGNGSDTLTGGGGLDDFVFASTNQPADEITDFTVEDDTLVFVASGFAGIATLGMVSVDMFTIGSNPSTTSHRFIYSAGSGELFYDQDGTGNSAKVKLADLDAGLPLTNSDFVII